MKKVLLALFMTITMTAVVFAQAFTVSLHVNSFTADDDDYKIIYGKGKILPEVKLNLKLYGSIYLWGSYGLLSIDGYNPLLEVDAASTTHFISGGLMYRLGYIAPQEMALKLEVGLCHIKFKEEIPQETYKASGTGFQACLGITYGIWKHFYGEVNIGYNYALGDIANISSRLGGFRIGAGLGLFFGRTRMARAVPLEK